MENEKLNNETILEEETNTSEEKAPEVSETSLENTEAEVKEEQPEEEPYNGPVATTAVRYDYKTMKYFNMYNMMYKRHFRLVYFIMGLISLALTGYELFVILTAEEFNASQFIIPAVFVLFGLYFIYQGIFFEKTVDKNISVHFYRQPKLVHINVTVTEKYLALKIADNDSEPFKYDWAYVNEIVEIPQYFFLYVQKQPIIIEKDPNKMIEGDYEEMIRMIHDQTATKPYKVVEKELVKKPITYVHPEDAEGYEEATEVTEITETEVTEENKENTEE